MKRAFVLLAAGVLYGQEVAFEVTSIKLSDVGAIQTTSRGGRIAMLPQVSGGPGSANPRQIQYLRVPLTFLVGRAYELARGDQIANPQALGGMRMYDIVANVPEGATAEQMPLMLQHLLRERFGLRFHNELRKRDVYVVRVGKDGAKLKESAPAPPPNSNAPRMPTGTHDDEGFPVLPPDYSGITARAAPGKIMMVAQRMKLESLLRFLESPLGRQLVDETGLKGLYDFRLAFANGAPAPNTADLPAEPIPTAQDALASLGLTLERAEREVEVMVIDGINPEPTEN